MASKKTLTLMGAILIAVCGFLTTADPAFAASKEKEKVLHSFSGNGSGGNQPYASLIFDASGNLYGTTSGGGAYGNYGTVFELTRLTGGGWAETILHSFNDNGTDGFYPQAGLIFDASGSLYGTTTFGGAYKYGTAFKLAPTAGGGWTEKVLHSFGRGKDGASPIAGLIFDASGNLYGTTVGGGANGYGTVFELAPTAGGGWTEKVLHDFSFNGRDGILPYARLIVDAAGNLYGTTYYGGAYGDNGTVFELAPKAGGDWSEKVLHSFGRGKDGATPYAALIFNASGTLYGTTVGGGAYNAGAVFELTPKAGGGRTEKVLYSFNDDGKDGSLPYASLIFDASGGLYGTTYYGGGGSSACGNPDYTGCGTVFELMPRTGGGWTEKVLYTFKGRGRGGKLPLAGLIVDATGNLYGTTTGGGASGSGCGGYGCGTVFELTP